MTILRRVSIVIRSFPPVFFAAAVAMGTLVSGAFQTTYGEVAYAGTFVQQYSQHARGSYQLLHTDGEYRLVLGDDFFASAGPDLHLMLSTLDHSAVSNNNIGQTRILHELVPGKQTLGPDTIDLGPIENINQYKSILNICIQFGNLVYGAAPLTQVAPSSNLRLNTLHPNPKVSTITMRPVVTVDRSRVLKGYLANGRANTISVPAYVIEIVE